MRRKHIHFAQGEPGESGFVRGLKQSSEVLIYLDTVNSFNFVGTNFRGLGKKGISWDS